MRLHTRHGSGPGGAPARDGYVILAVLMLVVVLSLVGYRFSDMMAAEYRAAARTGDDAQLKMAALAGLNYAAGVLSDRNTFNTQLGGNPFDNQAMFSAVPVTPADATGQPRTAYFSIYAAALDTTTNPSVAQQLYGVVDEGGKLNINALIALDPTGQTLYNALMQLPILVNNSNGPAVAASIVDWVDADEDARSDGAESAYYQALANPYMSKNGPLNSLDELLLIKGIDYTLLYGQDANRNGVQDGNESWDANTPGLASFVTVYGRELNVDSTGTTRIYLNGDDLTTMYQQLQQALGNDLATYVIASKLFPTAPVATTTTTATVSLGGTGVGSTMSSGSMTVTISGRSSAPAATTATTDQLAAAVQTKMAAASNSGQRIKSLTTLIGTQITLPTPAGSPANAPPLVAVSPLNDPTQAASLLPLLMDKCTVQQAIEMVPRVNVNTAPAEVLGSIVDQNGNPILDATTVQTILTNRATNVPTDPATISLAWLIAPPTGGGQPVLTAAQYQSLEKYITGTSLVYRIQSVGYFAEGGPVARMEAVVDTNQGSPRFLFVRDLTDIDNPPGFQPNQQAGGMQQK
jgi:hypothetical protein